MTLPARCCALAPAADIDRRLLRAPGLRQSSGLSLKLSIDGTDRRTDGRTPDRYIDACCIPRGQCVYCLHDVCVAAVSERGRSPGDGDGGEVSVSGCDSRADCYSLGTHTQRVRCVLHVTACTHARRTCNNKIRYDTIRDAILTCARKPT